MREDESFHAMSAETVTTTCILANLDTVRHHHIRTSQATPVGRQREARVFQTQLSVQERSADGIWALT